MATDPYASAWPVFWVVDNGSSHRNGTAAARMDDADPNAHMVHLPVRTSRLNQVKIYFWVVQPDSSCPAAALPTSQELTTSPTSVGRYPRVVGDTQLRTNLSLTMTWIRR